MDEDSGQNSLTDQTPSQPKPSWLDPPPPSRWRLVGGYALLLTLVLACAHLATVIWHSMTDAEVPELPATSAGTPAAPRVAYPASGVITPPVGNAPAIEEPRSDGCTPGAAALSLCSPSTTDARR